MVGYCECLFSFLWRDGDCTGVFHEHVIVELSVESSFKYEEIGNKNGGIKEDTRVMIDINLASTL